jgi:hypothetical protein
MISQTIRDSITTISPFAGRRDIPRVATPKPGRFGSRTAWLCACAAVRPLIVLGEYHDPRSLGYQPVAVLWTD